MELALGISASSRCCFVYYTLLTSVKHNDQRHSAPGRMSKELRRPLNLATRPLRTIIIAAGQAMGACVRRAKAKKTSIHVRSHIQNRPKFCHASFENFRPTPGPSAMELALGISASSLCCFVYCTLINVVDRNDERHSVPGRIPKELRRPIEGATRLYSN